MTQSQALKILKSGANVFLTGEPGSGKTYTINRYVEYLRSHAIEPAITASTGIAATHIGGMTIHSWSGIGIKSKLTPADLGDIVANDYVEKRVTSANVLIIDEISMLPPETLQSLDLICRQIRKNRQPFGGIQTILVGDFFQLPPVVNNSPNESESENLFNEEKPRFAYESPVWNQARFTTCYITEQYRQDDSDFLTILSKIRNNSFDSPSLELIRQRQFDYLKVPPGATKLFSHNIDVDNINNQMLAKLPGKAELFTMKTQGRESLIKVMKKSCLSPEKLYLKIGASTMFTKNNSKEGFVNGTLGTVEKIDSDTGLPIVKIRDGRKIKVLPADWTLEENGKVRGKLTQLPLRLAWALTVHKSQGVSLDEAVIDLSKVFEFGQGYVALSRVRRLSGVFLLGWNDVAFRIDENVLKADKNFRSASAEVEVTLEQMAKEKLVNTWKDFIIFCGGSTKALAITLGRKIKQPTQNITMELWKEGKNPDEIAKIRDLKRSTILNHLEKLLYDKKIDWPEILKITPAKVVSDLPKIQDAFKTFGGKKLSPLFEYFKGKYSYDDLKLARMLLK